MLEIEGTHQKGTGTASNNLKIQLPLIAKEFPEVGDCHFGTVNVLLDSPLFVVAPDHRTLSIPWNSKDHPNGEVFDLLRISIEIPKGSTALKGWLYIAHGSPHRATPNVHEVIVPFIQNFSPGMRCKLVINRKFATTPPFHPGYMRPGIYIF